MVTGLPPSLTAIWMPATRTDRNGRTEARVLISSGVNRITSSARPVCQLIDGPSLDAPETLSKVTRGLVKPPGSRGAGAAMTSEGTVSVLSALRRLEIRNDDVFAGGLCTCVAGGAAGSDRRGNKRVSHRLGVGCGGGRCGDQQQRHDG